MRALAILLTYLLLATAVPVRARQDMPQPSQAQPSCQDRSAAECWVWEQVQSGKVADLGEHCKQQKQLNAREDLDPRDTEEARWRDPCRAIGATFIKRMLTEEPWRNVLGHQSLRVRGARITDRLDFSATRVSAMVWLMNSRFEGEVDFNHARFAGSSNFDGSVFEHGLAADNLHVEDGVNLRFGEIRGNPLLLRGAWIGSDLDLEGATFKEGVEADGAYIAGALLMKGSKVHDRPLKLPGASVGGSVISEYSDFEAGIVANGVRISGGLFVIDRWTAAGTPCSSSKFD